MNEKYRGWAGKESEDDRYSERKLMNKNCTSNTGLLWAEIMSTHSSYVEVLTPSIYQSVSIFGDRSLKT